MFSKFSYNILNNNWKYIKYYENFYIAYKYIIFLFKTSWDLLFIFGFLNKYKTIFESIPNGLLFSINRNVIFYSYSKLVEIFYFYIEFINENNLKLFSKNYKYTLIFYLNFKFFFKYRKYCEIFYIAYKYIAFLFKISQKFFIFKFRFLNRSLFMKIIENYFQKHSKYTFISINRNINF